mgnify:CR=1 FL=1
MDIFSEMITFARKFKHYEDGDKKLVPSEAKIILTTISENTEKKWNATSEDHFEFYYRNFNKVGDIEKPEGVILQ